MLTIETQRLTLRPFEPQDLDTTHEYASDPMNTKYMIHLPNSSKQETWQFLQRVITEWEKSEPKFYEFAILLDGKHIGAVSIHHNNIKQEGELGWIIHKDYQGNGYATEAAKAVLDFGLKTLKIKKVFACCDYRNEPSYGVMRKIGLSLECDKGVRRYKGSQEDVLELMYSLTVDE